MAGDAVCLLPRDRGQRAVGNGNVFSVFALRFRLPGFGTADALTLGPDVCRRHLPVSARASLWLPFTIARSVAVKGRVCVEEVAAKLGEQFAFGFTTGGANIVASTAVPMQ